MNEWEWQLLEDKTLLDHVMVGGLALKHQHFQALFTIRHLPFYSFHGSMHLHQLFHRQQLGSLEYLPGTLIGAAHLSFFFFRQRHDAQGENFIDLSSVEEIAGAFGCDLRIVVKDDWRREHAIVRAFLSHQHGIGADVAAARS